MSKLQRRVTIHGGCYCGAEIVVTDGVWPDGHGLGKCVPEPEPRTDVVEGPTIEIPIAALFGDRAWRDGIARPGECATSHAPTTDPSVSLAGDTGEVGAVATCQLCRARLTLYAGPHGEPRMPAHEPGGG